MKWMLAMLAGGALVPACARPTVKETSTAAPASVGASGMPAVDEAPRTCFLLHEVGGALRIRKGEAFCAQRFPPASTFKVPHAMIALDTGARSGPDDLEKWDGKPKAFPAWEQDQTLATAVQRSAIWYFQRTAERIGRPRMSAYLSKLAYGNQSIGNDITMFWLDGSLEISADEQEEFMDRFVRRALPIRRSVMDTVDELIRQAPGTFARARPLELDVTWDPTQTQLFGKTGSIEFAGDSIRWVVGHVASHRKVFVYVSLVVAHRALSAEAVTQAVHELRDAGLLLRKE
jgi:beta-lactamase class D